MMINHLVKCIECGNTENIRIDSEDYQAWQQGELIQRAMPYLTPAERELLMSGICGECYNKLIPEEDE